MASSQLPDETLAEIKETFDQVSLYKARFE